MRYDLMTSIASSALNKLALLQQIIDHKDLQVLQTQASTPQHASPNLRGCVDSPEAATIILMLVGTVGIYYGSALFLRMARKRNQGHSSNA